MQTASNLAVLVPTFFTPPQLRFITLELRIGSVKIDLRTYWRSQDDDSENIRFIAICHPYLFLSAKQQATDATPASPTGP